MAQDNISKLYNALSSKNISDLGNEDQFREKIQDRQSADKLYGFLKEKNYFDDLGETSDDFYNKIIEGQTAQGGTATGQQPAEPSYPKQKEYPTEMQAEIDKRYNDPNNVAGSFKDKAQIAREIEDERNGSGFMKAAEQWINANFRSMSAEQKAAYDQQAANMGGAINGVLHPQTNAQPQQPVNTNTTQDLATLLEQKRYTSLSDDQKQYLMSILDKEKTGRREMTNADGTKEIVYKLNPNNDNDYWWMDKKGNVFYQKPESKHETLEKYFADPNVMKELDDAYDRGGEPAVQEQLAKNSKFKWTSDSDFALAYSTYLNKSSHIKNINNGYIDEALKAIADDKAEIHQTAKEASQFATPGYSDTYSRTYKEENYKKNSEWNRFAESWNKLKRERLGWIHDQKTLSAYYHNYKQQYENRLAEEGWSQNDINAILFSEPENVLEKSWNDIAKKTNYVIGGGLKNNFLLKAARYEQMTPMQRHLEELSQGTDPEAGTGTNILQSMVTFYSENPLYKIFGGLTGATMKYGSKWAQKFAATEKGRKMLSTLSLVPKNTPLYQEWRKEFEALGHTLSESKKLADIKVQSTLETSNLMKFINRGLIPSVQMGGTFGGADFTKAMTLGLSEGKTFTDALNESIKEGRGSFLSGMAAGGANALATAGMKFAGNALGKANNLLWNQATGLTGFTAEVSGFATVDYMNTVDEQMALRRKEFEANRQAMKDFGYADKDLPEWNETEERAAYAFSLFSNTFAQFAAFRVPNIYRATSTRRYTDADVDAAILKENERRERNGEPKMTLEEEKRERRRYIDPETGRYSTNHIAIFDGGFNNTINNIVRNVKDNFREKSKAENFADSMRWTDTEREMYANTPEVAKLMSDIYKMSQTAKNAAVSGEERKKVVQLLNKIADLARNHDEYPQTFINKLIYRVTGNNVMTSPVANTKVTWVYDNDAQANKYIMVATDARGRVVDRQICGTREEAENFATEYKQQVDVTNIMTDAGVITSADVNSHAEEWYNELIAEANELNQTKRGEELTAEERAKVAVAQKMNDIKNAIDTCNEQLKDIDTTTEEGQKKAQQLLLSIRMKQMELQSMSEMAIVRTLMENRSEAVQKIKERIAGANGLIPEQIDAAITGHTLDEATIMDSNPVNIGGGRWRTRQEQKMVDAYKEGIKEEADRIRNNEEASVTTENAAQPYTVDMTGKEKVKGEIAEALKNPNAVTVETQKARVMNAQAEQILAENGINTWDTAEIMKIAGDEHYDAAVREAAQTYLNTAEAMKGVAEAVRGEIGSKIDAERERLSGIELHKMNDEATGVTVRCTVKANGKQGYIVKGHPDGDPYVKVLFDGETEATDVKSDQIDTDNLQETNINDALNEMGNRLQQQYGNIAEAANRGGFVKQGEEIVVEGKRGKVVGVTVGKDGIQVADSYDVQIDGKVKQMSTADIYAARDAQIMADMEAEKQADANRQKMEDEAQQKREDAIKNYENLKATDVAKPGDVVVIYDENGNEVAYQVMQINNGNGDIHVTSGRGQYKTFKAQELQKEIDKAAVRREAKKGTLLELPDADGVMKTWEVFSITGDQVTLKNEDNIFRGMKPLEFENAVRDKLGLPRVDEAGEVEKQAVKDTSDFTPEEEAQAALEQSYLDHERMKADEEQKRSGKDPETGEFVAFPTNEQGHISIKPEDVPELYKMLSKKYGIDPVEKAATEIAEIEKQIDNLRTKTAQGADANERLQSALANKAEIDRLTKERNMWRLFIDMRGKEQLADKNFTGIVENADSYYFMQKSPATAELYNQFAKRFGFRLVLVPRRYKVVNGEETNQLVNGENDYINKIIYLNVDAFMGEAGSGIDITPEGKRITALDYMNAVFGHELTHTLFKNNPEMMDSYIKAVEAYLGKDKFEQLCKEKGSNYSSSEIREEVACDMSGQLMQDKNFVQALLESSAKDPEGTKPRSLEQRRGFFDKVKEKATDFFNKLQGINNIDDIHERAMSDLKAEFVNAFNKASENIDKQHEQDVASYNQRMVAEEGRMRIESAAREKAMKTAQARYDKMINDARKEFEGDDEALEILDRREPESLEEAISQYMPARSLVLDDYTDASGRVVRGLKSETGLSYEDLKRLNYFIGKRENGGKTVNQVAEEMWADFPENIKAQYSTVDTANALRDMLMTTQSVADFRHVTDMNRIEEARNVFNHNLEMAEYYGKYSARYNTAVNEGDKKSAAKIVEEVARKSGAAVGKDGKAVKLYHGTPHFGFTEFNSKRPSGAIFTSTLSRVSANYAGDQNYAGVRNVNKGYLEDHSTEGVIRNAQSVFGQNWRIATDAERNAIIAKVESDAKNIMAEMEALGKKAGELPEDEALDIQNATAWVENIIYDVVYGRENGNEGNEFYKMLSDDYENYNESKDVIRKYFDKHSDELDEDAKNYLRYLTHWKLGDVAIDAGYSYAKSFVEGDLITVDGQSLSTVKEIDDAISRVKDIGSYQMYGFLGDKPLEIDCKEKNWYNLDFNGMHDTDAIVEWAKQNGYTSVVFKNVYDYGDLADDYVFFESKQLKSADAITYDNEGNVIPIEKRFDQTSPDIRYSARTPEQKAAVEAVERKEANVDDEKYKDVAKAADGTFVASKDKETGDLAFNIAPENTAYSIRQEKEKQITYHQKQYSNEELRNKFIDESNMTDEQKAAVKKIMSDAVKMAEEQGATSKQMEIWNNAMVTMDEKGKPVFTVVIPDDEYPMNFGISLVCKRRRALDAVMGEISRSGLIDQLASDPMNIVAINQIIKDHGLEVACDLCYVEARRFRSIPNADKFTGAWNKMIESLDPTGKYGRRHHNFGENKEFKAKDILVTEGIEDAENGDLDFTYIDNVLAEYEKYKKMTKAEQEQYKKDGRPGAILAKQAQFIKDHPEVRKLLDRSDFADSEGFSNAHKRNDYILSLFNSTFGASNPKNSFGDRPYNGDFLTRSWKTDKAFHLGGVRFQSFDDYIGKNWFDYLAAHADLMTKGMPAHSYSKEELYVKTFGLTGNKINMSMVPDAIGDYPAGLDANGDYLWHEGYDIEVDRNGRRKIVRTDKQTFGWKDAREIRSAKGYRDNCGTIAVGVSDAHIWKMMFDPEIDMIIPYHASSLNKVIAHAMGGVGKFTDYTAYQIEHYAMDKGGTKKAGNGLTKGDKKKVPSINKLMTGKEHGGRGMGVRQAVEYYVRWCEKNGIQPKFEQFCYKREGDRMDGKILTDENGNKIINDGYYKFLADFKLIAQDEAGMEYDVPQKAVKLNMPKEGDAFGTFAELTQRGVNEWQEIHNDIETEMPGIVKDIKDKIINGGGLVKQKYAEAQQSMDNWGVNYTKAEVTPKEKYSTRTPLTEKQQKAYEAIDGKMSDAEKVEKYGAIETPDGIKFKIDDDPKYSMRVFHGSAADFEKFDEKFYKTGEGSMYYGAGTYVTNVEDTGRMYADVAMANKAAEGFGYGLNHRDKLNAQHWLDSMTYEKWLNRKLADINADRKDRTARYNKQINDPKFEKWWNVIEGSYNDAMKTFDEQEQMWKEHGRERYDEDKQHYERVANADLPIRHLYTVDVPDDNGHNYIPWEDKMRNDDMSVVAKKLYEEVIASDEDGMYDTPIAKNELKNEIASALKDVNGGDFYGTVQDYLGSDVKASEFLNNLGYTGVKVQTGATKGGDGRGMNYVIFDTNDAKIVGHEKYSTRRTEAYKLSGEEYTKKEKEWREIMNSIYNSLATEAQPISRSEDKERAVSSSIPNLFAKVKQNSLFISGLDNILSEINRNKVDFANVNSKIAGILRGKFEDGHYYPGAMVIPNNNEWSEVEPRFADHHANTDNNSEDVNSIGFVLQLPRNINPSFNSSDASHIELFYYNQRYDTGDVSKNKEFLKSYIEGIKHFFETGTYDKMPLPDECNTSGEADKMYNSIVTRGRVTQPTGNAIMSAFKEPRKRIKKKFSTRIEQSDPFYSNAAKAVEGIKQEKATPEQWLKMIEKAGGLKKEEDKWMGLSEWLKKQQAMAVVGDRAKTITRQEIEQFIAENSVKVEEVNYGENIVMKADDIKSEYPEIYNIFYTDDFNGNGLLPIKTGKTLAAIDLYNESNDNYIDPFDYSSDDMNVVREWATDLIVSKSNPIDDIRLDYTTNGLTNKREIALTVPTVDPYNQSDNLHFGYAGGGRAVAWLRFGDATTKVGAGKNAERSIMDDLEKKYKTTDPTVMTPEDAALKYYADFLARGVRGDHEVNEMFIKDEMGDKAEVTLKAYQKLAEESGGKGQKVLVIDEIQSKRHQDGREKGYQTKEQIDWLNAKNAKAISNNAAAYNEFCDRMVEKYGGTREGFEYVSRMNDAEYAEWERLESSSEGVEENDLVPDAPFRSNWHELAMKRALRYAAENGYDKVAWTTGRQQAIRYNIGTVVKDIRSGISVDGERSTIIKMHNGSQIVYDHDAEGNITSWHGSNDGNLAEAKHLSDVLGKELTTKILSQTERGTDGIVHYGGNDLMIGGEGMKGFYDQMLPKFMSKYGKKWGAKVGEVELDLPNEADRKMWSVDVTPEMKESVMQGQPMFSVRDAEPAGDIHTDNFKKWFGDWQKEPEKASKVVDKDGKPKVLYHGTNNKFTEFNEGEDGIWFTEKMYASNYGDNLMPVYIDMKNPYIGRPIDKDGNAIDWRAMGYDGWMDKAGDKFFTVVVDKPTQIKSATGNNGNFDPENPDIRYSTRLNGGAGGNGGYGGGMDAQKTVVDQIRSLMDNKLVSSMQKSDLTKLMNQIRFATEDNIVERVAAVQRRVREIESRVMGKEIADYLNLKNQDVNGRNMSIAKNVDNQTRQVMNEVKGRMYGVTTTDADESIHSLGSEIWHLRDENRQLQREIDASEQRGFPWAAGSQEYNDAKAKIQENEQLIADKVAEQKALKAQRDADVKSQIEYGGRDVQQQIDDLLAKMDDAVDPDKDVEWTEEDQVKWLTLDILKDRMDIEKDYQDLYDARQNRSNATTARERRAWDAMCESIEAQRFEKLKALRDKVKNLVEGGKENLAIQKQAEIEHRRDLIDGMMSDIRGNRGKRMPADPEKVEERSTGTKTQQTLEGLFAAPLKSFEYMAHAIDRNHFSRDGWFYQYFVKGKNGVMAAQSSYLKNYEQSMKTLNEKTEEIFGKKPTDVSEEGKKKVKDHGITMFVEDADGNVSRVPMHSIWGMEPIEVSKNQATYLYMVSKMGDGMAKLYDMGFDDTSIKQIKDFIDDKMVAWADYVQEEYLPSLYPRYNAKYTEIYGTPMADIENYVPLRIDKTQTQKESDLQDNKVARNSMQQKNSFQINRTINLNPVDLTTDCFEVIQKHIQDAEDFNAFATIRKDLDDLFSSNAVINQLNANHAGSAKALQEAARIAVHSEKPEDVHIVEKSLLRATKGIIGGNIAYRIGTALKQTLSAPVFYGYTGDPRFVGYMTKSLVKNFSLNAPGVVTGTLGSFVPGFDAKGTLIKHLDKGQWSGFYGDMKWAMDNVPSFKNRVSTGDMGNDIMNTDMGWFDKFLSKGMTANQLIDAVTCVSGIKAIYDYEMARMKPRVDRGEITAEEAHNMACTEADIFYNGTQQSSHRAFMSPVQTSQHAFQKAITAYQNASIGFARKAVENVVNLYKAANRQKMIDSYERAFVLGGMDAADARKAAEKKWSGAVYKSSIQLGMFGFLANFLWDLGGRGLFGLFQNDDQKKEAFAWQNIPSYFMRGTYGSNIANGLMQGSVKSPFLLYEELGDASEKAKKLYDDGGMSPELAEYAFVKAMRIPGVDLEVMANIYLGAESLAGKGATPEERMLAMEFMINLAKGNRKSTAAQIYKDMPLDEQAMVVLRAGKVFEQTDWRRWLPGASGLTEKKYNQVMTELAKIRVTDVQIDDNPMTETEMNDVIKHLNTDKDLQEAYAGCKNSKMREKILTKAKAVSKEDDFNAKSWKERAEAWQEKHNEDAGKSNRKKPKTDSAKAKEYFNSIVSYDVRRDEQKISDYMSKMSEKVDEYKASSTMNDERREYINRYHQMKSLQSAYNKTKTQLIKTGSDETEILKRLEDMRQQILGMMK